MPASYPKPDGSKVTRHKPRFDWVDLPAEHDLEAPELPDWRRWQPDTIVWWHELWTKPQATQWPPDGSSLHILAALIDDLIADREDAVKLSGEIRQHEDRHGLTPKAMLQLRWRYSETPAPPTSSSATVSAIGPAGSGTSSSMRSRLSIVHDLTDRQIRYECRACGKLTAGRRPRGGDGSLMFPRRHSVDGDVCPGSFDEAETVTV